MAWVIRTSSSSYRDTLGSQSLCLLFLEGTAGSSPRGGSWEL
jgi:hypothetical protein